MAFTNPLTWVAQNLTAVLLNQQLRDNMNETAPGIASAAGRLIVTDGANSIVERIPTTAEVDTTETTGSTSFGDLATAGPAVTVTTGTECWVVVGCNMANNTAGQFCFMSFAVSGATTAAAADNDALGYESSVALDQIAASRVTLVTGLTAGSNTFTAKFKVTGGNGSFKHRDISAIPL